MGHPTWLIFHWGFKFIVQDNDENHENWWCYSILHVEIVLLRIFHTFSAHFQDGFIWRIQIWLDSLVKSQMYVPCCCFILVHTSIFILYCLPIFNYVYLYVVFFRLVSEQRLLKRLPESLLRSTTQNSQVTFTQIREYVVKLLSSPARSWETRLLGKVFFILQ